MADPIQTPAENTITLGDKSYTQEELNTLVGLGQQAQEIATHHGSFEKFVTESGRRADEIGKMKQTLAERDKAIADYEAKLKTQSPQEGQLTLEQKEAARKAILDVLGGEPLTKNEAEQWYQARRETERITEHMDVLEGEIDGSDGRPKFDKKEMIDWMVENKVNNPEIAYKIRFEKELDDWKTTQLNQTKGQPFVTKPAGGPGKQPAPVKLTRDNLVEQVREALQGASEE